MCCVNTSLLYVLMNPRFCYIVVECEIECLCVYVSISTESEAQTGWLNMQGNWFLFDF